MASIGYDDDMSFAPARTAPAAEPHGYGGRLAAWWQAWRLRQQHRRTLTDLSQLNPHLLRDMGFEPQDVAWAARHRSMSLLFEALPPDGRD